jgi:hypothetical protein
MRKQFFVWLFLASAFFVSGQGNTLYVINSVTPKPGNKMAFETAWKTHAAKFHKSSDKRSVYEIMSGDHIGTYLIMEGPFSFADLDKDKPMAKEHAADLDKNYFPILEDERSNAYFRLDDTASYKPSTQADKFLVIVTHYRAGQLNANLREAKRSALLQMQLPSPSPVAYNIFVQLWAGSDPVMVMARKLKDGFASLEDNYYGMNSNPPNALKDAYIKTYGQTDWDARQKLIDDPTNIVKREVYITKVRKDLSTM